MPVQQSEGLEESGKLTRKMRLSDTLLTQIVSVIKEPLGLNE